MKQNFRMLLPVLFLTIFISLSTSAYATNGMNLEGYGPVAAGMGGASMAYDNGTAALMNNPATLGLLQEGNLFDLSLGYLGPHITSKYDGAPDAESSADAFFMPAFGWAAKKGKLSYGAGLFSQGGMGTEYTKDSFMAAGSNEEVMSQVGVGRLLAPVAYEVNSKLSIGATVDLVWATMDLKMALSGAQFIDMSSFPGATQTYGSVSGSMMDVFGSFVFGGGSVPAGTINPSNPVNWGRFDFADDNDFTGKSMGIGPAAKVGAVYKVMNNLSVGAVYQSKTFLGDLEADSATLTFNANVDTGVAGGGAPSGTYEAMTIPVKGKIKVNDFEWPQIIGTGIACQVIDPLMLVLDYKWINWAGVMESFRMTFTADSDQSGLAAGFADTELNAEMKQKWEDQHVFMIGAAYKVTNEFTARAGANFANNPVPDKYMNPLFPAIVTNHYTLGAGYLFTKEASANFSFTYAPEVEKKNGQDVTVSHSQINMQIMFSYLL